MHEYLKGDVIVSTHDFELLFVSMFLKNTTTVCFYCGCFD